MPEGIINAVMGVHQASKVDFLVIGGGVAGLRAAIDLATEGSVLLLSKGDPLQFSAHHAHSGITVATGEDEDFTLHLHEALRAGDGLCREEAVRILVQDGSREVRQLTEWGARLEAKAPAQLPGHRKRTHLVGSPGEPAGAEILRTLTAKAKSLKPVRTRQGAMAVDLLMDGRKACGAIYLDETSRSLKCVRAAAVLVATGGLGQVYAETTNPPGAGGDGVALAFRAGALLSDMEFIQFHPTVLYTHNGPRRALPEALREKGGHLRNLELKRFMSRYHEAGDLAPADVIARAILMEIQSSRGEFVYLDLTGLSAEEVKRSFPRTYADCMESNMDITSDLVPVRPAAHFAIGGVATDLECATTINGLYAAGETAANGMHGANRLADNGLLEGLVYGARAAAAMKAGHGPAPWPEGMPNLIQRAPAPQAEGDAPTTRAQLEAVTAEIRHLMWNSAGIIRKGAKLSEAARRLDAMHLHHPARGSRLYYETENLLEVARVIVICALERKESRGAHYRADFPLRNDSKPAGHSFIARGSPVFSDITMGRLHRLVADSP